jgi:hypothetical protein
MHWVEVVAARVDRREIFTQSVQLKPDGNILCCIASGHQIAECS